MKYNLITLLLVSLSFITWAQSEKATERRIGEQFEHYYNQGQYDSIFYLFSAEMKAALPQDKTVAFLEDLKAQAGKIKARTFIQYENGSYAAYKTNFEHGVFSLNISCDQASHINGLFVKPYVPSDLPIIERNSTKMKLPFSGEWTVVWGGDTKEQNYHVESKAQKNAFDILIKNEKDLTYKTNGATNEDYYAFGQKLLAPCDGKVVLVVDGIKDNVPGTMNPVYVPGNTVIIETANKEYLFFAHFKQHSIVVKEGATVKQGQLLGLCGNSGNSSEPHLHFHIQNVEDMTIATGVKCYFDALKVNGQRKNDYSPVQSDKISNL